MLYVSFNGPHLVTTSSGGREGDEVGAYGFCDLIKLGPGSSLIEGRGVGGVIQATHSLDGCV